MENAKNKTNKKVTRTFKNIVTAALLSAFTFVANEGIAQNTTNNDNNIRTSQTINRISLSDYHSLLDKRNQIMRDKYKDYDTRELLESTQKEVFLRAYKNNDNLVRTNINNLQKILNEKFKIKTNDAIEILNQSLILIANSGEIEGLKNFTNQISIKTFDINTINAIGLIEANYPNLWKEKGYDTPTWNTTNRGLLKIVVNLLDKTQNTANFNDYARPTKTSEKPVDTNKTTKDNDKTTNIGEDVINLDGDKEQGNNPVNTQTKTNEKNTDSQKIEKTVEPSIPKENGIIDLDGGMINLDEEPVMPKTSTKNTPQQTKPENKPVVNEKPIKTEKPVDTKKSEIEEKKTKKTSNEIDLDVGTIDLDSPQEENYNLENNAVDLNFSYTEANETYFIEYDYQTKLSQDLDLKTQKENIENLMNEYMVIKDFVNSLKEVGVDFSKGDDTNINRTSAILRVVNGDYLFGKDLVESAKFNKKYGTDAMGRISLRGTMKNDVNKENRKIVEDTSWDLATLEKKLSKNKLNNVSYQEILTVVDGFKDNELKKIFMYRLLSNDVIEAQKIMGMSLSCDSRYPDYKAGDKIGQVELNKIKKLGEYRKYMSQNEILNNKNIPQDVKNIYLDFVNKKINNKGKDYMILSKTDFKVYLFSANHHLLSRQNILIGSEVGDHMNNPMKGNRTTPGGLYEVGNSFEKSSSGEEFFKKYGTHYIVLIPMNKQYTPSEQYTMGVHGTYEKDKSRDVKINSLNAKDHRATNGCINVPDKTFGEIFNHMKMGSIFFVTKEPSDKDIENFIVVKK